MHYHSNHFTCHKSNWENKPFQDAEVCVTIRNNLYLFSDVIYNIENPDFNLLLEEKNLYDENGRIDNTIDTLKPNILEWLNENIEDQKDLKENSNGEEIIIDRSHPSLYKGWCINNDESTNYGEFDIFFTRQLDALRFINEFSIFKEPLTYFDYFNYDRREMEINKIIEIINNNSNQNLELDKIEFEIHEDSINNKNYNNLDVRTFKLLDWESINFYVSDDKKEEYYNILNNTNDLNLQF